MNQPHDLARDVGMAVAKTVPPVTVWALTLNEWLAVAAIIYTALQAGYLIWKWVREWRHARRNRQMAAQASR